MKQITSFSQLIISTLATAVISTAAAAQTRDANAAQTEYATTVRTLHADTGNSFKFRGNDGDSIAGNSNGGKASNSCVDSFINGGTPGNGRDTISLLFIGDVMAHSRQLEFALKAGGDSLNWEDYDFSSYFSHVKPYLDSADFTVANMESVYGVTPYTGYPCFSAPKSLAVEAVKSGTDLFLCANNHICDKGLKGVDSTLTIYSELGVLHTGLYRDSTTAAELNPLMVNICGFNVAFVNFTYDTNGIDIPDPYVVNLMDSTAVRNAIFKARNLNADYIIALPHWGIEYNLDCSSEQSRWAEDMIRWGADAIVGSHPHVVQKTTFEDGHPVAYSLGNFISNMSIEYSQIGMLYRFSIVRLEDGTVKAVNPESIYTWCGRGGCLEDNYTVVPIEDYMNHPEAFKQRSQYDKMAREWKVIKDKFIQGQ